MKTRATLLYIITLLLTVFSVQPVQAQAVQDALYIFRNDGKFDAFFYGDIKRIEYSKIDTLGVEQPDYVVQEIYALDTLYRIPISAIDSVAFVTPETKIKDDVFCPDKSIADYITASDSVVWIRLATNTPASLIPKVGDKLFIEEASKYLPNGFVGLVTKVDNGTNGYTVTTGDLELVDIFDRLVAKAAASTMPANSGTRLIDGTEMSYTSETPIDIIDSEGNYALTGSYTIGKLGPVEFSGDLSGNIKYKLKSQMEIRAFLFFDALTHQYQYDQKIRTDNSFDLEAAITGSLTGSVDFPVKKLGKKLSDFFKAEIEAGFTVGAQFTALSLGFKYHADGEIHSYLVQRDDNWNPLSAIAPEPHIQMGAKNANSKAEFDINIDGTWSLNTGAYAQVDLGVAYPFKKGAAKAEDKGPGIEIKLRGEIGGKLDFDLPVLGISPEKIISPLTAIDNYNKLNEHGKVSTGGYAKAGLSGELGKWKINGERGIDFLEKDLYYIVPNFTEFKVEQDKEEPIRPYRIRMSSVADHDILLGTKIGFEVYDDNDKLVADSLCNFYFREDSYKTNIANGTNGCVFKLDPDKENVRTLHAYPMVLYRNNHLIAKDLRYDFTLDPARIDIAEREFMIGSDLGSKEIEVIPNMANMEVKVEGDWLNETPPIWLDHLNQLTIYWPELPKDVKDRRGVVRLTGKSQKGETLVEDSIVVRQFVPYVELTPDKLEFDAKGGTQTVTIGNTNLTNLKVRANSDDIKLKFEGNTITVTMDENKTADVRGGTIYVEGKNPDGTTGDYGVILVTQKAGSEEKTEEPTEDFGDIVIKDGYPDEYDRKMPVNWSTSQAKFFIEEKPSNLKDLSVTCPQSYIHIVELIENYNNICVKFDIDPNYTENERVATIIVSAKKPDGTPIKSIVYVNQGSSGVSLEKIKEISLKCQFPSSYKSRYYKQTRDGIEKTEILEDKYSLLGGYKYYIGEDFDKYRDLKGKVKLDITGTGTNTSPLHVVATYTYIGTESGDRVGEETLSFDLPQGFFESEKMMNVEYKASVKDNDGRRKIESVLKVSELPYKYEKYLRTPISLEWTGTRAEGAKITEFKSVFYDEYNFDREKYTSIEEITWIHESDDEDSVSVGISW